MSWFKHILLVNTKGLSVAKLRCKPSPKMKLQGLAWQVTQAMASLAWRKWCWLVSRRLYIPHPLPLWNVFIDTHCVVYLSMAACESRRYMALSVTYRGVVQLFPYHGFWHIHPLLHAAAGLKVRCFIVCHLEKGHDNNLNAKFRGL